MRRTDEWSNVAELLIAFKQKVDLTARMACMVGQEQPEVVDRGA